jgi:transcriptional regulator with XRE-family HTH domain
MQLVESLDRLRTSLNNEAMAQERAGKRVKQWSREHQMNQILFASRAKISVGSLQAFERGARETRKTTIRKIAAAMGLTTDELKAEPSPADGPDPRVLHFKDDDYLMARLYHHASADVKHAIKYLLASDLTEAVRDRIARLLAELLHLDEPMLAALEHFLHESTDDETPEHKTDGPKKKSS